MKMNFNFLVGPQPEVTNQIMREASAIWLGGFFPIRKFLLYPTKNFQVSPGLCAASFTAANPGTGDPFETDRCPNKDAKAPAAPALIKHKLLKINSIIFSRVE